MTDDVQAKRSEHVEAVFGGEAVTFRLERGSHWADVIAVWIGSPLAVYHRLLAGTWMPQDIAAVLCLAFVAQPGRALGYVPAVEEAVTARGAGRYSVLALRILEAHLFGLDPSAAVFDENAPFPEGVAA